VAIKAASVSRKPSAPAGRVVCPGEPNLGGTDMVRYLYQPGELEGGRRRATDPVWSLTIHTVNYVLRQPGQPALYYLNEGAPDVLSAFNHEGKTPAPKRGFVREELMIIPRETELPPHSVGAVSHKSR
jgi:hypothetical protein